MKIEKLKIKIKNTNKILGILVFFALIGTGINAQPINLTDNETSYAEDVVNNYINSSEVNLTNYTLKVVPVAFYMNEKKLVDVFSIPEKPAEGVINFIVDLNSGEVIKKVIKKFIKPKPKFFRKSMQDRVMIREALRIANNDSEIKKQFAMLNFTKIPHIPHMQAYNHNRFHVAFMPMMLPINGLEERHNVSVIDANISLEDRKVLGCGVRRLFAGKYGGCEGENCTFAGRHEKRGAKY